MKKYIIITTILILASFAGCQFFTEPAAIEERRQSSNPAAGLSIPSEGSNDQSKPVIPAPPR